MILGPFLFGRLSTMYTRYFPVSTLIEQEMISGLAFGCLFFPNFPLTFLSFYYCLLGYIMAFSNNSNVSTPYFPYIGSLIQNPVTITYLQPEDFNLNCNP